MASAEEHKHLPEEDFDEAQCRAALATLDRLQAQLDDLRLTIPRVLQPLNAPPTSSTVLFSNFKHAVTGSQDVIKAFRARWQSPELQSIFDYTERSLSNNADLSAGAQVPRYGWKNAGTVQTPAVRQSGVAATDKEDVAQHLTRGDVESVVEGFRKQHASLKAEMSWADEGRMDVSEGAGADAAFPVDIAISFIALGTRLKFQVHVEREVNGQAKITAECVGETRPCTDISKSIASRPRPNDLKYLLDMIAAYKTVKGERCAKCKKLLNGAAEYPTARRSKQTTPSSEKENTETVWEALHIGCLD